MAHRVTVRDARGQVAREVVVIRDVKDDRDVIDAAKRACKSNHRVYPEPARITVEKEIQRGRWQVVRKVVD